MAKKNKKTRLFEVKTNDYDTYYVWAEDFQDAYLKTEKQIAGNCHESIIEEDGSLNLNFNLSSVTDISIIKNKYVIL